MIAHENIFRYPSRFDIIQAKFGIDLIRLKDIEKMKQFMKTYSAASEKGQQLEMDFIDVQEHCESYSWPEGGAEILKFGHELFPGSEVSIKRFNLKITFRNREFRIVSLQ